MLIENTEITTRIVTKFRDGRDTYLDCSLTTTVKEVKDPSEATHIVLSVGPNRLPTSPIFLKVVEMEADKVENSVIPDIENLCLLALERHYSNEKFHPEFEAAAKECDCRSVVVHITNSAALGSVNLLTGTMHGHSVTLLASAGTATFDITDELVSAYRSMFGIRSGIKRTRTGPEFKTEAIKRKQSIPEPAMGPYDQEGEPGNVMFATSPYSNHIPHAGNLNVSHIAALMQQLSQRVVELERRVANLHGNRY